MTRYGRLGWSLSEVLGPGNTELDSEQLRQITRAFADAGVPQQSAICALESILSADYTTRHGTRRHRQRDLEDRLWELQEDASTQDVMDLDV